MKQSKFQLISSQDDDTLYELYYQLGSIAKVLNHFGIKKDPRSRKYISQSIKNITGNSAHSEKHRASFNVELFLNVAPHCSSITEVLRKMELQPMGGNFTQIKKRLKKHNITLKPLNRKMWSDEDVYCESSSFNRRSLQNRVRRDGWLEYLCDVCENPGEWLGKPITLHLDHINGDNTDHRKENLWWLCPNCHTQTPTYTGRNRK